MGLEVGAGIKHIITTWIVTSTTFSTQPSQLVKSFPAWNNAVQWPDRPAKNQQAWQEEGGYSLQQHNKAEFKPLQRKKTEHRVGKQGQSRANMSKNRISDGDI
jgi:hypothetical protein